MDNYGNYGQLRQTVVNRGDASSTMVKETDERQAVWGTGSAEMEAPSIWTKESSRKH